MPCPAGCAPNPPVVPNPPRLSPDVACGAAAGAAPKEKGAEVEEGGRGRKGRGGGGGSEGG